MKPAPQSTRFTGIALVGISILISWILYFRVPWSLDSTAFLLRPLLLFAFPIMIAGISLLIRAPNLQRNMVFPAVIGVLGLLGAFLLYDWPSQGPYFWEDSYQTLAVLEAGYAQISVPFLICCFMTLRNSLPKKAPQHDL